VLCELEPGTEGKGLNLTKYTLWGIIHHSSIRKQLDNGNVIEYPFYQDIIDSLNPYWSFEGYVVAQADEIAQRHQDIEDSLRYDLISRDVLLKALEDLKLQGVNKKNYDNLVKAKDGELSHFISLFSRFLVNMYVVDLVSRGKENFKN
jgi:dGTPase